MPNVGEMTKKEIVARLKELGAKFDSESLKNELENILVAAEKKAEKKPEPPKEEVKKDEESKASGKITAQDLKNFPPLKEGYKAVRMTQEQAKNLQCWYDPKVGIGVIKG